MLFSDLHCPYWIISHRSNLIFQIVSTHTSNQASIYMHACMLSYFSCVRLCATLFPIAPQAPPFTGILQARLLEWVGMPSSRGSS